jgi:dATP pyrophosphohydrolase
MRYKVPISVLVIIHTHALEVLLLERASHPGFWQSVTGSQEAGETLAETAAREVGEETGLDVRRFGLDDWYQQNRFEIFRQWRHRYRPGVTHNTEHVFGLCLPSPQPVAIAPREHLGYQWLPWQAAAETVLSWSNAAAIRELPRRAAAGK